jgi:hypothetical membrane protein
VPYTPLIIGLAKDLEDKSHTFLTWFLYLTLDCITMFSGEKVRINMDPMVFGFAIGSLIMSSVLFYQRRFVKCTMVEFTTIILIIICVVIWKSVGSYFALVASIASEGIIGIYLIIETYKYPKVKYNLTGYLGFIIVSILSVISTKAWSIEEVGFALSETILSFVILIPLIKKWWNERKLVLN